ncbi:hypothetical protein INT43_005012 [Umbelopsis isabellina]|uniref:Uncharacterized protein n=1 Tax=Mortierella isabellina TaxID=91625 RepID=A0A8H7PGL2_MORIS|nr:hypothetical protein INT43_005012 [Umbelopsis isabellina]
MAPEYQHLGRGNDFSGMMLKYRCARALTIASMAAIVLLALASVFYPGLKGTPEFHIGESNKDYAQDYDVPVPIESPDTVASNDKIGTDDYTITEPEGKCSLPTTLTIPKSEDGSYTPTSPHSDILAILSSVPEDDYEQYCQGWRKLVKPDYPYTYNLNGECGNWQEKYAALHKRRLTQLDSLKANDLDKLDSQDRPTYIAYKCVQVATNGNRGCGGLADRMSGMISTFFYALLTDRAYFAYWDDENPFSLDILFEKPFIDWHYEKSAMDQLFIGDVDDDYFGTQPVDTLNAKWPTMENTLFPDGASQNFSDLWTASLVQVRSNRGYIIHTFESSNVYPDILHKMGLNVHNTFGCLTDYLFKPTIGSRRFIDAYKNLLDLESIFSVGIQIRTGDNQIVNPKEDELTVESYSYFLTCANQLTKAYRQPYHKKVVYFLITDSAKLRDEMMDLNTNAATHQEYLSSKDTVVLTTGLPIEHVEPAQVAKYINITEPIVETQEQKVAGINSAVIENWLLANTNYRVISQQGYGKLAAFHSNIDGTTYGMPRITSKHRAPDCGNPKAATSFHDLSMLWSLG